jgi:hypothetical protein
MTCSQGKREALHLFRRALRVCVRVLRRQRRVASYPLSPWQRESPLTPHGKNMARTPATLWGGG